MSSDSALRRENHFVPDWYQKGFCADGQGENFVLDKTGGRWIEIPGKGKQFLPQRVRKRGPTKFLRTRDLYTTILLGKPNDESEIRLFGIIDALGSRAVRMLCAWPSETRWPSTAIPKNFG